MKEELIALHFCIDENPDGILIPYSFDPIMILDYKSLNKPIPMNTREIAVATKKGKGHYSLTFYGLTDGINLFTVKNPVGMKYDTKLQFEHVPFSLFTEDGRIFVENTRLKIPEIASSPYQDYLEYLETKYREIIADIHEDGRFTVTANRYFTFRRDSIKVETS
jgi:hypothetical protein